MRINKLLSNLGICSRKDAARLIEENRIIVNGEVCIPGQWVEESDEILLDNKAIKGRDKVYIALNKPIGITCTADSGVKGNIIEYMGYKEYIFPVGRLDKESEGLIILTNDGDLANKILESENEHEKEYIVSLNKAYDEEFLKGMASGVKINDGITRPCTVTRIDDNTFRIILTQGLNKQIRRMSKVFGYKVIKLQRIRIMNILLEGIEYGHWRYLTEDEVVKLRES